MASTFVERDIREDLTSSKEPCAVEPPLVVDLDGTCVKTDLLLEYLLALLRKSPRYLFLLPFWLAKGRSHFAREVVRRASLDVSLLPYRLELLDYLKQQRAQGRSIVLATRNDAQLTWQLADYLMLFDETLASGNSPKESQRDRLVRRFGEKGFDYATSGRSEIAILTSARRVILVHPSLRAEMSVARVAQVDRIFEARGQQKMDYLKPLRPRHWLKNVLVFAAVFAAHRFDETALLGKALVAFVALCCCASSGYLLNDLFDLAADRHHPRKRFRPFAAGDLPLSYALSLIPLLVLVGCIMGAMVSPLCVAMLLAYFVLTVTYSLYLKRVALLDVLVLAGLYTLRVMVGSAAVAIWPSPWLAAFSMFLFVSLAFVKRYSELLTMRNVDGEAARASGYEAGDAELLAAKGTASGYLAVLVLAFYITSGPAHILYSRHQLMWILCPLLLYWIGRMWLVAHRGQMGDDPVLFATSDRTSRILILLMLVTAVLAL
jgi:4-hydroxybenzoate polyprenyltransferase